MDEAETHFSNIHFKTLTHGYSQHRRPLLCEERRASREVRSPWTSTLETEGRGGRRRLEGFEAKDFEVTCQGSR